MRSVPRRLLVLATPLALAACAAPGGPRLSPAEDDAVNRVQAWFDGLDVLRARFLEIDPGGRSAQGTVVFARGGRLRLDYGPGDRAVVIAAAGRIVALDRTSGAVTRMGPNGTPLGLLLRDPVRLRGDGIDVAQAIAEPGSVQISLAPSRNHGEGLLTLVFASRPDGTLVLSSIEAVDAERRHTDFRFFDVRTGGAVPPSLFDADALAAAARAADG